MHVTIVHLTEDINGKAAFSEDAVFEQNESAFPDGVTKETGELRDERLAMFTDLLGDAVTTGTARRADGSEARWVELDTDRIEPLFATHHANFLRAARKLASCTLGDFASSGGELARAMYELNCAYKFDWAYVLNDFGEATPISSWLRVARYAGMPRLQRFYVQAVYDGDQ